VLGHKSRPFIGAAFVFSEDDLAGNNCAQFILDFFERFDFWRIYLPVVTIVLVRRCRLVVLYGLLGVRLHEPLLHRGRLLFLGGWTCFKVFLASWRMTPLFPHRL